MAECYRCPYTTTTKKKYGSITTCNLTPTNMDVSYYCREKHLNEDNDFCPFVNVNTRFRGVDYTKYETEFLTAKGGLV